MSFRRAFARALAAGLFAVTLAQAAPDLVAPFTVDLLSSKHWLWDSVQVTTYLVNQGTTGTNAMSFDWTAVILRVDSTIQYKNHEVYAGNSLTPGYYYLFRDTLTVVKGPFSVSTWCDPLGVSGEGGGELLGNVRSQVYNFHPQIRYDTVTVVEIDTLRDSVFFHDTAYVYDTAYIHDTTRLVDTVWARDTVYVRDTIPVGGTSHLAKATAAPMIAGEIYTITGRLVWKGVTPMGRVPQVRLAEGTHVFIQGDRRRLLKVRYRH